MAFTGTPFETALDVMVSVSVVLLLWGFVDKSRYSPLIRIAGWLLFSAYWPFQAHKYLEESDDPVNAFLTQWGPLLLLYFAWHEWKSFKWNEEVKALRWVSGTAAIAAGTFFVFEFSEPAALWLQEFTAWETAIMLQTLFGLDATTDGVHIFNNGDYAVTIILACTAIQSIMIFVGAVYCVEASSHKKWRALLVAVPIIHVLNLFRNAGIVYGYKVLAWNPLDWGPATSQGARDYAQGSFDWMHSYVGKFGSLGALIVIALAVFIIIPELHQNILDLWDLWKRKKPGFFAKEPPVMAPTPSGANPGGALAASTGGARNASDAAGK